MEQNLYCGWHAIFYLHSSLLVGRCGKCTSNRYTVFGHLANSLFMLLQAIVTSEMTFFFFLCTVKDLGTLAWGGTNYVHFYASTKTPGSGKGRLQDSSFYSVLVPFSKMEPKSWLGLVITIKLQISNNWPELITALPLFLSPKDFLQRQC